MTVAGWLTVPQLAALLGVSRGWVYEGVASRRLPHHRVGRYVRFSPDDVGRLERQSQIEPTRNARPLRSA